MCDSPLSFPYQALGSYVRCGTLYDLSDAKIEEKESNFFGENLTFSSISKTTCDLKKIASEFPNLLALCDVHPQYRLFTLLTTLPDNTRIANLDNYSRPIDQYTRIMKYRIHTKTQSLHDDILRDIEIAETAENKNDRTTHIVQSVKFGIEVIAMIQLPANAEEAEKIDQKLEFFCRGLNLNYDNHLLDTNTAKLGSVCSIEIFSNVPRLCKDIGSLRSLLLEIKELQRDPLQEQQPYCYELYPISQDSRKISISPEIIERIENQLLPVRQIMRRIKTGIDEPHSYCRQHFHEWHQRILTKYARIKEGFRQVQARFTRSIERMAREQCDSGEVDVLLADERIIVLRRKVEQLFDEVNRWHVKDQFISELFFRRIQYLKFNGSYSTQAIQSAVRTIFSNYEKNIPIICSTDELYQRKEKEFNDRYEKLRQDDPASSMVLMIYVDLIDVVAPMDDFEDLKLNEENDDQLSERSSRSTNSAQSANEETDIQTRNILLVSSSMTDQKKLIDIFTRTLSCRTYEEVMSNPMNIPVPVNNAILSGENGSQSPQCRSYLFKLNNDRYDHRQLRLIMAPPLGSPEAYTTQSSHIEEIILFSKSYRRLHGICFLLKLNEENFDVQLRHDLEKLLKFFDVRFQQNYLFCSTEVESSDDRFQTSIRTMRTLLQELLQVRLIPSENCFGFDTQWLQYQSNRESSVRPCLHETDPLRRSMQQSNEERQRFCNYVFNQLDRNQYENDLVDPLTKVRFDIWLRIPLLVDEIMNCWRNMVLFEKESSAAKIKITFEHLQDYYAICNECKNPPEQCSKFYIFVPCIKSFARDRFKCGHSSNNRSLAYYLHKYEQTDLPLTKEMMETYKSKFNRLLKISVICDYILRDQPDEPSENSFLVKLQRMINEERDIQQNYPSRPLQRSFLAKLEGVQTNYKKMMRDLVDAKELPPTPDDISPLIEELDQNETISAGLSSIYRWLRSVSTDHEHLLTGDRNSH